MNGCRAAWLALASMFAAISVGPVPALAQDARAQPTVAAPLVEVEVRRGVEYVKHDGVALTGDLYVPKAVGKYPVVVAVHGGGWQVGNSGNYRSWGGYLAARGIAVFAINYRLMKPGEKTYPKAVHDVRAAVQFVKAKATDLKTDPERVALMGDSAGAHLAALVALAGDDAAFAGAHTDDPHASVSTKVKAVVAVYGIYDMTQQVDHDLLSRPQDPIVSRFLGEMPWQNRKLYFEASPMSYVTSSNRSASFLLAYGTEDDVVDREQSDKFLLALKQAGYFARNTVLPGLGHYWFTADPLDDPSGGSARVAPSVMRFLQSRL